MGLKDTQPEYELGETMLKLALIRPQLQDRGDVLERLAELYRAWGKPEEQACVVAQLAQLRQAQGRWSSPSAVAVAAPASKRKPGRNAPCWCGSGRKYKHCYLPADPTR